MSGCRGHDTTPLPRLGRYRERCRAEYVDVELAKRNVPTALKANRARAAAGLRTSAAHARWEEIDRGDVAPVIELTKVIRAEDYAHMLEGLRKAGWED